MPLSFRPFDQGGNAASVSVESRTVMIIHVVGAALIQDGLCLVAKRGPTMSLPGKWEFPGGKVEPDESPEAALARELSEELGVAVRVGPFLARGSARSEHKLIQLDIYAAVLQRGTPTLREHQEARWLSADELPDLDWAEADIPALPAVQRYMRLL
jgi:8-oxo-dGTP diphosphatase